MVWQGDSEGSVVTTSDSFPSLCHPYWFFLHLIHLSFFPPTHVPRTSAITPYPYVYLHHSNPPLTHTLNYVGATLSAWPCRHTPVTATLSSQSLFHKFTLSTCAHLIAVSAVPLCAYRPGRRGAPTLHWRAADVQHWLTYFIDMPLSRWRAALPGRRGLLDRGETICRFLHSVGADRCLPCLRRLAA